VEAKDLLFVRVKGKADPSIAENRRDLGMTLVRIFPATFLELVSLSLSAAGHGSRLPGRRQGHKYVTKKIRD
jgi:hypothetical protein